MYKAKQQGKKIGRAKINVDQESIQRMRSE
jgi:hypothetical protein